MIVLKIFAKILFLPFYIILLFLSIILFLLCLALNSQTTFEEVLESFGIDDYWSFDL